MIDLTKEKTYKLGFILSTGSKNGLRITKAEEYGFYDISFHYKYIEFRLFDHIEREFQMTSYLKREQCDLIPEAWDALDAAIDATLNRKEIKDVQQT